MASVRVSPEELKAEVEKLHTVIDKLCQSNTNSSSTIDYMREKYDRILCCWLDPKKKTETQLTLEVDAKSTHIIEDQKLHEFIPENTKPAW